MRPTKIGGGSEMCDVLLGVPGSVTKCDRGGEVKIGQKLRDVLYGRPLSRNIRLSLLCSDFSVTNFTGQLIRLPPWGVLEFANMDIFYFGNLAANFCVL